MAKKLTSKTRPPTRQPLSNRTSSPFTICFKYKLQNRYTFSDLKPDNLKGLQAFLDKVSGMTFQQVDQTYRRTSDSSDVFQDEQVIHYAVSRQFRIHGIIENGQFVVLRLDPEHKVHR